MLSEATNFCKIFLGGDTPQTPLFPALRAHLALRPKALLRFASVASPPRPAATQPWPPASLSMGAPLYSGDRGPTVLSVRPWPYYQQAYCGTFIKVQFRSAPTCTNAIIVIFNEIFSYVNIQHVLLCIS